MALLSYITNSYFYCDRDDTVDTGFVIRGWKHSYLNIKPHDYNNDPYSPDTGFVYSMYGKPILTEEAPGIYQAIDLSNYQSEIQVLVKFSAYCHPDFDGADFCFYIYEIEEPDSLTTPKNFKIIGTYKDYIHRTKYSVVNNGFIDTFNVIVTLRPGYYALGFGCDMLIYDDKDECFFYDINGLCLWSIDLTIAETDEIFYVNLLSDSGKPIPRGSGGCTYTVEPIRYYCPEDIYESSNSLGAYTICQVYHTRTDITTLSGMEYNQVGAYYKIKIPEIQKPDSNIDEFAGRLRFWYRSDLPEGTKFKIRLYDIYVSSSSYIDEILTTKNEWTLFTYKVDWIPSSDFYLYIYPPVESNSTGDPLYIGGVGEFYYYTYTETPTNNRTGDFDNPYNYEDGCLTWEYVSEGVYNPKFILDSGKSIGEGKFIRIVDKYYLTKDNDGTLYCDGLYGFKGADGLPYCRFFSPTCEMAFSQNLVIDNKSITIDDSGVGTISRSVMKNLNMYIEGFDENMKVFECLKGESIVLQATFNEMYPPALLSLTYDKSILSVINSLYNTEENEFGYYNTSNTVELLVKTSGKSEIKASYTNPDGTVFEESIIIYAIDEVYPSDDIVIVLPYEKTCMTLGSSLQLSCRIEPFRNYEIPIDWISSDESIATIDAFGYLKTVGYGTCTITAINHKSGSYASYTLNVVDSLEYAYRATFDKSEVIIGVNDTTRVTAELSHGNIYKENISQAKTWYVQDESIATIDDFGYVTGLSVGTTTIYCYSRGEEVGSIPLTVRESVSLDYIELGSDEIPFIIGDSSAYEILEPTLAPRDTTQTAVVWSSHNYDVAKINNNGKLTPNADATEEASCLVRCLSLTKPNVYAECTVSLVNREDYVPVIYLPKTPLVAVIGEEHKIKCSASNTDLIDKTLSISIKNTNGGTTNNIVSMGDGYINLTCFEAGEYIITVTCTYTRTWISYDTPQTISKDYSVHIQAEDNSPVFTNSLAVEETFYNGSYMLKYLAEDDVDSELKHEVFVDGEKTDLKAASYLYNGLTRHHVFGRGLNPGTQHTAYVIITDSAGHTVQSNTVSFDIKNIENYSYKDVLQESKNNSYDIYKNDIIDYLTALINDEFVSLSEKREFETRYQRYCFAYEGFRYVLDTCIKYINSQISTQQAAIAAIAAGLTSDGTSVATYSEDDYTNSNYQSITDMDYYQNECIRELTNRVLQLEALLQELMNNNN